MDDKGEGRGGQVIMERQGGVQLSREREGRRPGE